MIFYLYFRSTYEEKISKLERTLDNAVAAAVTPSNINTDSILSVPDQLFTDSLRCKTHSEICADHSLAELYSRGPTPVVYGRMDRDTPALDVRSDTATPVVTDTESRYSYVPLRRASALSLDRNKTPTNCNTDTSDIIRELGLDNTETSPPRWYNPPPEKLDPSPDRQPYASERPNSNFLPLRTKSSKR